MHNINKSFLCQYYTIRAQRNQKKFSLNENEESIFLLIGRFDMLIQIIYWKIYQRRKKSYFYTFKISLNIIKGIFLFS